MDTLPGGIWSLSGLLDAAHEPVPETDPQLAELAAKLWSQLRRDTSD